jgi:hypothetical protein
MRILLACEESQRVCIEFRKLGHKAYSCDIKPCSGGHPDWHIQGDVLEVLKEQWDMIIAFPPCTYLCSSGLHWNKRKPGRYILTDLAFDFFMKIANADCQKIAIENPVGCVSTKWRKPDQIIQPYNFGDNASKKTCLWLKNIPLLTNTQYVEPRYVNGLPRWANQCDSGQNSLGFSKNRALLRSKTYPGIASAMAVQWGNTSTSLQSDPVQMSLFK